MGETREDITVNSGLDTQGKDYVCPQCGPDPAGADAHAESHHTWPPGDGDTLTLREFIRRHADHLDSGIHDLQQTTARLEKMITEIHAELEAAQPLIERWRRSAIVRLAQGSMPWTGR